MMVNIRNTKGFSLTELLVVVVILGILVSLAIPKYTSTIQQAKVETCRANIRSINSAIAAYEAKHKGTAPEDMDALVLQTGDAANSKFFDEAPMCPVTNGAYELNSCGTAVDTTAHFTNWRTDEDHL